MRTALTAERLRELMDYDPATGVFVKREYVDHRGRKIRARVVGSVNKKGYVYIRIAGKQYLASRLAWLYMRGCWPDHEIDHKSNIRTDNRFDNLRDATELGNSGNRGPNKNNRCGFKGVFQHRAGKWCAQISLHGKHTHLGVFDTPESAARAYDAASLAHFGEFSKTNKMLGLLS